MKIALIGNMNNNHFSLMRYFRDLGADAHLFPYTTDGVGSLSHFSPTCDSYQVEKWSPYIHKSELCNGGKTALLQIITKRNSVLNFRAYDKIVANGFFVAFASVLGMRIDLALPYSVGGDHLNYFGSGRLGSEMIFKICRLLQVRGYQNNCKSIFYADNQKSEFYNFKTIGVETLPIPMPMVYLENEESGQIENDLRFSEFFYRLKTNQVVFSHVSHLWKGKHLMAQVKRNDVAIRGFAKYLQASQNKNFVLALLDYGRDVADSRALISELGIEQNVIWLPKMLRREILALLSFVSVGISELGGCMWGGVGWEFMSKGVPFLHNFEGSFKELSNGNFEEPPYYNVKTESEIASVLLDLEMYPERRQKAAKEIKLWFETYNGKNLAKKYLDFLESNNDQSVFNYSSSRGVNVS